MDAQFKIQIKNQLKLIEEDIDKLLTIKGTITDLNALPDGFASKVQDFVNWIEVYRTRLENT